jgi:hypothetical protein
MKRPPLRNKKGQLQQLGLMAVGIATLAITLVITFLVISEGQEQIIDTESLVSEANETSYALNATKTLASAVDDVPGWVPLIVITVIGAVLLGLVAMFTKGGR